MDFAAGLLALLLACVTPATREVPAGSVLRREPDLGVSCRQANSIACDRVKLAIWLRAPAVALSARVAGRLIVLRPPGEVGWWEGELHPAGLLDGALRVTPDRGRFWWAGGHPVDARVRVRITRRDGSVDQTAVTVALRAGWG